MWYITYNISSVQLLSHVQLFAAPWTAARWASLSITSSRSLLKLMSIESVMPSNHLILCHPLLLPPSIVPSIRVFSNKSVLSIRWPKYWSFSFSISLSNEYSGLWCRKELDTTERLSLSLFFFNLLHYNGLRVIMYVSVFCSTAIIYRFPYHSHVYSCLLMNWLLFSWNSIAKLSGI